MNFIAGESSSDSLEEAFPNRIEALFQGLATLRWLQAAGSDGEAKPSAQAGFGSCHFARHLRGVTRRRTWAWFAGRVDRALTHAALPSHDVLKTVRRKEDGEIVGQ